MLVDIKEVPQKLNDKWLEIQKQFYVCYSVKELAYEVGYKLKDELGDDFFKGKNVKEIEDDVYNVYYRYYNDKHKIIFPLFMFQNKDGKQKIMYVSYDIYWVTGMFGDSGLKVSNAILKLKIPKCYKYIEDVLEDDEEVE